jgi:hypothetical protein
MILGDLKDCEDRKNVRLRLKLDIKLGIGGLNMDYCHF